MAKCLSNSFLRYFWKLVVDPVKKEGVVLIGMNYPFASTKNSLNYICPEITYHNFLKNKGGDVFGGILGGGYMYACEVKNLVPYFPNKFNDIPLQQVDGNIVVQDLDGNYVQINGYLKGE